MKRPLILAVAAIAFGASAALAIVRPPVQDAAPATSVATGPATGDAAHGKQLFVAIGCYQCHGYVGQGSQSTGPALVPLRLSDEGFVRYLRNPRGVMPAFSAHLLPAADARDVLAYVRSLSPGAPPDRISLLAPYVVHGVAPRAPVAAASSAPIDTAAGGKLFAANCAACHGAALRGGIGPALRGTSLSADQIAAIILNPPSRMPKLSPAPLDAEQVHQVAVYVRMQQ